MQSEQFSMEDLYPLIMEVIGSGGEFRLFPRGTSMNPLIYEGKDSVALVKATNPKPRGIYLYRRKNGDFVLHRLLSIDEKGNPVFCGDNQTVPEYGVKKEDILAEVSAVYHGEKRVSVEALSYRFYVRIHSVMFFRKLRFLPRRAVAFLRRKRKK